MSGVPSPKQSSSSGSAASFIKQDKVRKQIQSDDEDILIKKMQQLQVSFPILKKVQAQLTNQQKLFLFIRDNIFRHKLFDKLFQQFENQKTPILKVQVYSTRYRSVIQKQLDENDLIKVFDRFGKISAIYVEKTDAFLRFDSVMSSYLALKTLDEFDIICDLLKLSVRWCKPDEQLVAEQHFLTKFNTLTNAFGNFSLFEKFNSKYQIYLPCPPEFKIAQKIIGPKGNNMKKIFEVISQEHKIASIKDLQKDLKLRLRGKGSGYSQGPNGQQSDEILNFCISSKEKSLHDSACKYIEKIFQKLAKDYKLQFERMYRRTLEGTVFKKYELATNQYVLEKQLKIQQLPSNLPFLNENQKILSVREIEEQINLRNKTRKLGKYQQADEIREKLKKKGVVLIDGTGRKNTHETTWSYID